MDEIRRIKKYIYYWWIKLNKKSVIDDINKITLNDIKGGRVYGNDRYETGSRINLLNSMYSNHIYKLGQES